MSYLGKLYYAVLHKCTKRKVNKNLMKKEQAGFRQKTRTTNHIFTLFSAIKKDIRPGQKLYTYFIDLICIWLNLQKKTHWIDREILKTIETMHSPPKLSLLFNNRISQPFESILEFKQCDVLNTLLFNFFIRDLPELYITLSNVDDNDEIPKLVQLIIKKFQNYITQIPGARCL